MTSILGYEFNDPALLEEALVTPSCKMDNPKILDNQRLEFLGDAVLGLLAADRLYAELPREKEGALTVRRTHMVSSAALCDAAARLDLAPLLKRNAGAAPLPPNSKTIADAVEAIIGAVWLDGGLAAARKVFDALALSSNFVPGGGIDNPKGELQIRTQAMKPPRRPTYTLVQVQGRSDEPVFTVRVSVEGLGEATASARTRQEAEQRAAASLISSSVGM